MLSLFAPKGKFLGMIRSHVGSMAITSKDDQIISSLDGCNMISSEPKKFSKTIPILCLMMAPDREANDISVWSKEKGKKQIDEVIKTMETDRGVKVRILEDQPDEHQENQPREMKSSCRDDLLLGMNIYQKNVQTANETLNEIKDLSGSLLRRKIPTNMWGGKEVGRLMESVSKDMENLARDEETFEAAIEASERKTTIAANMVGNSIVKKDVTAEIVNGLIKDFFTIKDMLPKVAIALYPLYSIDKMFKKATGYPTTWFFEPSTLYDFTFCYENLVGNHVKLANDERSAMEPLFVWFQSTQR